MSGEHELTILLYKQVVRYESNGTNAQHVNPL